MICESTLFHDNPRYPIQCHFKAGHTLPFGLRYGYGRLWPRLAPQDAVLWCANPRYSTIIHDIPFYSIATVASIVRNRHHTDNQEGHWKLIIYCDLELPLRGSLAEAKRDSAEAKWLQEPQRDNASLWAVSRISSETRESKQYIVKYTVWAASSGLRELRDLGK